LRCYALNSAPDTLVPNMTVNFYFSSTLMCSMTLCQCLQQIAACLWSPFCEKMWILKAVNYELWTDPMKTKKLCRIFYTALMVWLRHGKMEQKG